MTTVLAGMLIPRLRVSVANTTLTSPASNSSSTVSLNAGSIPAWWAATPAASDSRNSKKPSATRSSSPIQAARASASSRMRSDSFWVVRWTFAWRSHLTLRSQPARLNTK